MRVAPDPVCAVKAAPATLTKTLRFMGYMIPRNSEPEGRKMRVDTTVVETDIHYPTDSTLLGDGVRALTLVMKNVTAVVGKAARG